MESILIKQGEECKLEQISDCAIEALRPKDFRCNTCGNASMLLAEEQSNFKDGVAYPISQGSTSEGNWALNAAGAYDEAKWSNYMSSFATCAAPRRCRKSNPPARMPTGSCEMHNYDRLRLPHTTCTTHSTLPLSPLGIEDVRL